MIGRREFFIFVPALLLSVLPTLFLPTSSVSLSYFILVVPMRKCLGKHSYISSPFPIAILNSTCFFLTVQLQVHNENPVRYSGNADALVNLNNKLNYSYTALGKHFVSHVCARVCNLCSQP